MKKFRETLAIVGAGLCVAALLGGLLYLDYSAYRQRFPNAAPWTYLFRGGK